jgi:hypothetical protein
MRLRDELLNGEIFCTLAEAKVIFEGWRCHYNTLRPHSSLGYRPPAQEVRLWQANLVWHVASDPDSSSTIALELTFQLDHRLGAGD